MQEKIGFIGAGNMSSAIITGIVKSNVMPSSNILAYDIDLSKVQKLSQEYNITAVDNINNLIKNSDIIILAVKPNMVFKVLQGIKSNFNNDKMLVSIVAGYPIANIESIIGEDNKIVRTMPNIAALVQESMTSITPNSQVNEEDLSKVNKIFSCFGRCATVKEELIHSVIGVSGSSPAYTFIYIEALADAAVLEGMPRDVAYEFAAQAVLGAAKTLLETKLHPAVLKDMVCSPAGTSIEALKTLERLNFRSSVIHASQDATNKSKELSKK